jgi:uracil-DNA glycosylase
MQTITRGNRSAKILIVGEAPGENEVREGRPFVGASGKELGRMLQEAGYDIRWNEKRTEWESPEIRITNVCHVRPPQNKFDAFFDLPKKEAKTRADIHHECGVFYTNEVAVGLNLLRMEIESMPNLRQIIGVGNAPLWALTGNLGITKWRGSQLFASRLSRPIPFIPTYHPANILRQWENRWIAVMDLKRARLWDVANYAVPKYNFYVRPSFRGVMVRLDSFLDKLKRGQRIKLAIDIETRLGYIACIGLADSSRDAMCIPIITVGGSYWSPDEEAEIVWKLYSLLTHRNVRGIGQNFLYDQQYIAKHWGFSVHITDDTMLKQHVCLPGISKGLDFLSSQYCEFHQYWKDESKDWDPRIGEEQLWIYNCKDAVVTFEANDRLTEAVQTFSKESQLRDQMEDYETAFEMMLRGINTDLERKKRVAEELETAMLELFEFCNEALGVKFQQPAHIEEVKKLRCFNPASSKQVQSLAYDVLKLPPQWVRTDEGRRLTANKEAIDAWCETADPLYRPLLRAVKDYRSLQVFRSTFALADLDNDGRWRCSISVAGANTFRWTTSEDAFGFGTNMQNIPKGDEDD